MTKAHSKTIKTKIKMKGNSKLILSNSSVIGNLSLLIMNRALSNAFLWNYIHVTRCRYKTGKQKKMHWMYPYKETDVTKQNWGKRSTEKEKNWK